MTTFSTQLIERLQRQFRNRYKQEITVEEASQYLGSFAELFGLFWDEPTE